MSALTPSLLVKTGGVRRASVTRLTSFQGLGCAALVHMGRITFTADAHHEDIIAEMEQHEDIDSTAAAVRECITRSAELQTECTKLEARVSELETEVERLQN